MKKREADFEEWKGQRDESRRAARPEPKDESGRMPVRHSGDSTVGGLEEFQEQKALKRREAEFEAWKAQQSEPGPKPLRPSEDGGPAGVMPVPPVPPPSEPLQGSGRRPVRPAAQKTPEEEAASKEQESLENSRPSSGSGI